MRGRAPDDAVPTPNRRREPSAGPPAAQESKPRRGVRRRLALVTPHLETLATPAHLEALHALGELIPPLDHPDDTFTTPRQPSDSHRPESAAPTG